MIKLAIDREKVTSLMDAVVDRTIQMDLTWDWPCGVAYHGIARAWETCGKKEYLDLLKGKVDELISLGLPAWTVNTCAMGHCLITLYNATGDEKYLDIAKSKAEYLTHSALRFSDSVLQHTVSVNNDFPEQAWADTLMMAASFLLRLGVLLKDRDMVNDALHQYARHIDFLQDPSSGFWYHGWNNLTGDHMSGFYWARANAWGTYTMAMVSSVLPEPYLYPEYMDIQGSLREQLQALKKVQTENGLWHTILNDPESYEEMSASCGIAAGMLMNGNPLHTRFAQKAYQGILENITEDGRVLNVSGGTAVMRDLDGYRNISRRWTQGWGQGLALCFLCEALKSGAPD